MRSVSLLAAVLMGILPLMAVSKAPDEDADIDRWIGKMGDALRTQNYEGIFTYMRGHQFDTVEIIHRFKDGEEIERLMHLNGELREIIRHGDEIVCRHENTGHLDVNHEVPIGPFTHVFNENLANYQSFYDFDMLGEDRVAGRDTIKIAITPKHDDRWGYRLWLDKDSGLLLQSHLVGRGKVLEVFQFSRVEIGGDIPDEALESELTGDVAVHELSSGEPLVAHEGNPKPQWRASWLPTGFRQVASPRPNRIVFTDGIATFSVFIERNQKRGEFGTLMGGTAVITRRLKGSSQQITVVGEVPIDTAEKVAESIEPVIY